MSTFLAPTCRVPALGRFDIQSRADLVPPPLIAASRASRSTEVGKVLTVIDTGDETWVPPAVFSEAVAENVSACVIAARTAHVRAIADQKNESAARLR